MKIHGRKLLSLGLLFSLIFLTSAVFAKQSWHSWVKDLRSEAISQGISPHMFDKTFAGMTPSRKHINLDRSQPEHRLTYIKYRNTRGDNYRIVIGRKRYKKHKALVNQIGQRYGVDPCVIMSIWGLESSYGAYLGNFDVIRSLATLAYDGRRSAFFRKQLLLALHMLNDGVVSRDVFHGEWAGASGQSQFLPSSWYSYAVDYDGDGKKDIWRNLPDAFASIANYLHKNGWQAGQPVLVQVNLPSGINKKLLTLKYQQSVHKWLQMGVRIKSGQHTPNQNLSASVILPYGGPALMVFNNFHTIMTWNFSSYYAGTVNYVANGICHR